MKGFVQGLYQLCEWIMRLTLLQIYWFLFSLLGGVILGIFPSTVAMFEINRRWIKGELDLPTFKYFWFAFKQQFGRANILGYLLSLIGFIIIIDFHIFLGFDSVLFMFFTSMLIVITLLYILILIYIFPIFVTYKVRIHRSIAFACLIGIYKMKSTILIIVVSFLLCLVFSTFPPVFFFLGISTSSLILMWISRSTLLDIKESFSTKNSSVEKV
ncbi:DUF624 domain-containing protein [Bacillaceae bacterium S4-13-56]